VAAVVIGIDTKAGFVYRLGDMVIASGVLTQSVGNLHDCLWLGDRPFLVGDVNALRVGHGSNQRQGCHA
jgi:hypothetical protein